MAKGLTAAKAKTILEDGTIRGKALTEKQKKFFGAVAGGATPLQKLNGGWLDKFQDGGDINFDSVQRAVRNVESLDGKLMWNPESTATGLYGQRFSEIKNEYPGTRKEFAADTMAQKDFFNKRFYEGLPATKTTALVKDANDLYKEYAPQIPGFDYSKEDIAILSNFLGRQGAREYLGYHVRDKKPLEEALPNIYGSDAKQRNKTPEQYLKQAREYYKEGGWLDKFDNGGVQPNYNNSNVSLPPGFEGWGYNTSGESYNGAWNGPVAQDGQRVADIATRWEMNEIDSGRPPLNIVEKVRSWFDPDSCVRDNTCVQTVKDIQSEAGIYAIPDDVYNNRAFLKNYKQYGFTEITDEKDLQPGDILQYYSRDEKEAEKETPYHMGIYVSPGEYIGDGDSKAPTQRKNMYYEYDSKGTRYDKDPFRIFRYTPPKKQMGGSLPGATGMMYARTSGTSPEEPKKTQDGGVIEDDRGQWAYPGEVTKINSNNITMKGVNYPVLGISDTGDTKMMQPGKDYKFKGNNVTEFPMAQKGMNVEGQNQRKWFDSYLRSDKYLERLGKEFPEMNADELANERWARLMNMRSTPIGFLPESSDISPTPDSTQGVYNADEYPGKIMLRPEYSEGKQGPWSYNTIPLHEMGHAVDEGGKRIPQTTLDFLMPKLKQNSYDVPKEQFYYTEPTEYINRLQPLRYLLQEEGIYDAKKKDFTKEDLQKAKENTRIKYNRHFKDLMENTESEEDFIEIMNTIAANPQMQQGTMVAQDGKNIQQLDEVVINGVRNTPEWKAYQDSLQAYNSNQKLIDLYTKYKEDEVKTSNAYWDYVSSGEIRGRRYGDSTAKDLTEKRLKVHDDFEQARKDNNFFNFKGIERSEKLPIQYLENYQYNFDTIKSRIVDSYLMGYKKPTKPKETSLKTLVKPEGYKFYNPTAEPISPLPEFAVKEVPYNISMQRFIGEEQDGFRYGKDEKGNLVKIQTREDYRSKNRRPNDKEYKNGGALAELDQLTNFTNYNTPQPGGWLDKYQ